MADDNEDPFAESTDDPPSVMYYQNDDGQPSRKSRATQAELLEYDDEGEITNRTHFLIGGGPKTGSAGRRSSGPNR